MENQDRNCTNKPLLELARLVAMLERKEAERKAREDEEKS